MKKFIIVLVIGLAVAWTTHKYDKDSSIDSATTSAEISRLTEVSMPGNVQSQIKKYSNYTVSFNRDTHTPNWVAWVLTGEHTTGDVKRSNKFWTDESVIGCASTSDYRNTGYDRGHMAPAGDMKWDEQAMEECFSMANIVPQAHTLNSGSWGKLEEKCRQRAVADSIVVIVCGPVPTDAPVAHIGLSSVAVPQRFFKGILSPTARPPKAIGFIMPNGYVDGGMQKCAVSVDSVESLTGYDFFAALPDEIENELESQCNFPQWSHTRR
ncbi:MAG: DNA/RNA non-specific endonuclease [Candidatus Amulumruptor caecigallinarius]|nr:MAG: DNA/RNA non-specific endonuclease [Candidatus Amulumruptor caecigallinarius]